MRIILLSCYCLICCSAIAQPKNYKEAKRIYTLLLKYYLTRQRENILVSDSTSNIAICTDSFANIVVERSVLIGKVSIDSGWINDLIEADRQKTMLKTESFPVIKWGSGKISLINKNNLYASISTQLQKGIIEITPDYLQFSNVILIGNRAIVSLDKITPDLRGGRRLFFLEKRKRKWLIVSCLLKSIS